MKKWNIGHYTMATMLGLAVSGQLAPQAFAQSNPAVPHATQQEDVAKNSTPSRATGSYDGLWVITAPQIGGQDETGMKCPSLRLPLQVNDNRISGSWEYVQTGPNMPTVEAGTDHGAAPVVGSVNPDGSFTAQWMALHFTGKLDGNRLQMSWRDECGPRAAMGGQDPTLAALLTSGERFAQSPAHPQAAAK